LAAAVAVGVACAGIVAADSEPKKPEAKKPAAGALNSTKAPRSAGAAAVAANPNEPIVARVNNEVVTYKALAEECIARKGAEVLDTMISKALVMQACRERGIRVTPEEIDEEIRNTAQRLNMTPEKYLSVLENERDISAERYAKDIVWPGLALKKLAKPYVKVTDEDIERGFQAYYGEKVKCRWIVLDNLPTAMKIWNELRDSSKDDSGKVALAEFERLVTRWSTDHSTRSIGGQLQPISRNTSPAFQKIEQAAFALKEDGEISSVVQMGESHVILYREARIPPAEVQLDEVRNKISADITEIKMREQIAQVFEEIRKNATIENLLTGDVSKPEPKAATADKPAAPKQPVKAAVKQDATKRPADTIRK
jgi:foldase protein PrsA